MQDEDNMEESLRHSVALLGELRTSMLGPQKYYELYMHVNDELQLLLVRFVLVSMCVMGLEVAGSNYQYIHR